MRKLLGTGGKIGSGNIAMTILTLLKVKSLMTLVLTAVFAYMLLTQMEIPKYFETVYTVIVSFFFGTIYESNRNNGNIENNGNNGDKEK